MDEMKWTARFSDIMNLMRVHVSFPVYGICMRENSRYNMDFSVAYNSILQYPNSYIRVKGEPFMP